MSQTATRPARRVKDPASIDPRIRERRQSVARSRGRRRVLFMSPLILLALLLTTFVLAGHSSLLAARSLTVTGPHEHTSQAAILAAAGLAGHPPMLDVNPGSVTKKLEALPWVSKATVELHWPDGVSISVSERTAVGAVARPGGGWVEVDHTGRLLADVASVPAGLAQVVGVGTVGAPGEWLSTASLPLLDIAATLPPAFRSDVTAISTASGGTVQLELTGGTHVVLGMPSDLRAKYEDVASLLAGDPPKAGSVVNVSAPESPTVTAP